jgi:hypothetical protein
LRKWLEEDDEERPLDFVLECLITYDSFSNEPKTSQQKFKISRAEGPYLIGASLNGREERIISEKQAINKSHYQELWMYFNEGIRDG